MLKLDKGAAILQPRQNLRHLDRQVLGDGRLDETDGIHDAQRRALEPPDDIGQVLIGLPLPHEQAT